MGYTLNQAARASGKGKSTLLRAIRDGRLSGMRDEAAGIWTIEPAELHRLFPPVAVPGTDPIPEATGTPSRTDRTAELEARIAEMQESARLRTEMIAGLQADKEDLRRRLDQATALLTDQRPARVWWRWR